MRSSYPRPAKLVMFRGKANQRRWHLKAANGRIIANGGEGIQTNANRIISIQAVARAFGMTLFAGQFPPPGASCRLSPHGFSSPHKMHQIKDDEQATLIIGNDDPMPRRVSP